MADQKPKDLSYTPLHPELFKYDEAFINRFLDPAIRKLPDNPRSLVKENAEQIYEFRLFTEEFCKLLLEEAEHCGQWVTKNYDYTSPHPTQEGLTELRIKNEDAPDTCLSLKNMPPLVDVYTAVINNHVRPIIESLWVTFKIQKMDTPFLLKYEPHVINKMKLHYDLETCSMIIYLNHDFTGGGTHFPKWNFTIAKPPIGTAVVYPGGISHEHQGLEITSGRRYLLLGCFY